MVLTGAKTISEISTDSLVREVDHYQTSRHVD